MDLKKIIYSVLEKLSNDIKKEGKIDEFNDKIITPVWKYMMNQKLKYTIRHIYIYIIGLSVIILLILIINIVNLFLHLKK